MKIIILMNKLENVNQLQVKYQIVFIIKIIMNVLNVILTQF